MKRLLEIKSQRFGKYSKKAAGAAKNAGKQVANKAQKKVKSVK